MRFGARHRRSCLIGEGCYLDVQDTSAGEFSEDPMEVLERWSSFREWARSQDLAEGLPYQDRDLTCPVPAPSQIFAIGLNYRDHAVEASMEIPDNPMVFTKFPSSLTGPRGDIHLVPGSCDWEVEMVAVIGERARNGSEDDASQVIAGLTVGQDVSERELQLQGTNPQFNLGKSHRTFAPLGPCVVTLDEFDNPWDLGIRCELNNAVVQEARTSQLLNGVPALVSYLSGVCELRPGDRVFTGTPSGVGLGRTPPQYLDAGDVLVSTIDGIGSLVNQCV